MSFYFRKFELEKDGKLLTRKVEELEVEKLLAWKSGKVVELIVKKIVNNQVISNLSSLSNPECLDEYKLKVDKL